MKYLADFVGRLGEHELGTEVGSSGEVVDVDFEEMLEGSEGVVGATICELGRMLIEEIEVIVEELELAR